MESKKLSKLRIMVGLIAMSIIPVCALVSKIWGTPWETGTILSFSDFYWTNARSLFIAGISILGFIYLFFNGEDWIDKIVSTLTGISLFGVIFFPLINGTITGNGFQNTFDLFPQLDGKLSETLHNVFGLSSFFFQVLNVVWLFNRHVDFTEKKNIIRRRIFIGAGSFIFLLFGILTLNLVLHMIIPYAYLCIAIQTISFIILGICWCIKGDLFKFI